MVLHLLLNHFFFKRNQDTIMLCVFFLEHRYPNSFPQFTDEHQHEAFTTADRSYAAFWVIRR